MQVNSLMVTVSIFQSHELGRGAGVGRLMSLQGQKLRCSY